MTAFLPQTDPNPLRREKALARAQRTYVYNYGHVSPLAIVDRVPMHDEFRFGWLMHVAEHVTVGLANRAELECDPHHRDHHLSKHGLVRQLLTRGETAIRDLRHLVSEALKLHERVGATGARPEALDDYADLFRTIGLPPVARDYQDDSVFAWLRVAGPNPLMLRRLEERLDHFPVTDAQLDQAEPGDSLEAAIAEQRLYLADYRLLDGAEMGSYPHGQKYVYAPLALFVVSRADGRLRPVAIQCRQKPATDNPVFTPDDGYNWLIAKTIVEIADGNVHEAHSHLGRTHLFMEPFVVSTYRQIAPNHPLGLLLHPHFEGTLAINEAAWQHLIANKGAVDKLFGASINASRGLAVQGVQSADVMKVLLPCALAERGVDDGERLPHYPYRDDALRYWDAIRDWVTSYLELYYESDQHVQQDDEIQNWGRELAAQEGGRLRGLPSDGAISTRDELADILTLVIFTCSVQHAAVNFPQYDLMSYVPNMPLASYTPAPVTKTGATEADYLAMLPPLDMAELQMELGYLLGTVHYTQLGQYGTHHFRDPRVATSLRTFQDRLASIHGAIAERNSRERAYATLDPVGVPQSINI